MKKITKAEFIHELKENTTALVVTTPFSKDLTVEKVEKALNTDGVCSCTKWLLDESPREVTYYSANKVTFSNGSNVYLNKPSKNEFYTLELTDNVIMLIYLNTVYDEWDECDKTQVLVYGYQL